MTRTLYALLALIVVGVFSLATVQVYAQESGTNDVATEPELDTAVDSAVNLVVSISVLISAAASLVAYLAAKFKWNKIAHGAEYLKGTDEEVLARLNEMRGVVRALVEFEPRAGEFLKKHKVDVDRLDTKANQLTEEIKQIHNLAEGEIREETRP